MPCHIEGKELARYCGETESAAEEKTTGKEGAEIKTMHVQMCSTDISMTPYHPILRREKWSYRPLNLLSRQPP